MPGPLGFYHRYYEPHKMQTDVDDSFLPAIGILTCKVAQRQANFNHSHCTDYHYQTFGVNCIVPFTFGERINNDAQPVNQTAQLKEPLAIAAVTGFCSILAGAYFWSNGNERDQKQQQRSSIIGTGSQIG
jgi:hypothetical protein